MEETVELRHVHAEEISLLNKLEPNTTVKLTFRYKHNIRYPAADVARAEMSVTAEDGSAPDRFRLTVTEVGIFSCPAGMSREAIHVETFKAMFPFIRALCASVTASAGIPPVMIPQVKINEENVCRIDFRPPAPGSNGGGNADVSE